MRTRTDRLALVARVALSRRRRAPPTKAECAARRRRRLRRLETEAPGVARLIRAAATCRRLMRRSRRAMRRTLVRGRRTPRCSCRRASRSRPIATGFTAPRQMKLAPNGDIFLAESDAKRIRVLRPAPARRRAAGQRCSPTGSNTGPTASPSIRRGPIRTSSMSRPKARCCAIPITTAISTASGAARDDRARRAGRPSLDARHRVLARRQAHAARGRLGRQ